MLATKNQFVKCLSCLAGAALFLGQSLCAQTSTTVLNDTFDTYTNGNLVGQGGWTQTGTSAVTPIQVNNGTAVLGTSGQDAYEAFTSAAPHTDGNQLITNFSANVASAQGTGVSGGDYFLHLGATLGGTSGFFNKVFVESATGGFLLGVTGTATTNIGYGTTVLTLGTTYNLQTVWTFVPGAANDTISLFYNPTNPTGTPNTLYVTYTFQASETEPTSSLVEANLRQGSSTAAAGVTVDNLLVTSVASVPEPSTTAAVFAGGAILFALGRLRSNRMRA